MIQFHGYSCWWCVTWVPWSAVHFFLKTVRARPSYTFKKKTGILSAEWEMTGTPFCQLKVSKSSKKRVNKVDLKKSTCFRKTNLKNRNITSSLARCVRWTEDEATSVGRKRWCLYRWSCCHGYVEPACHGNQTERTADVKSAQTWIQLLSVTSPVRRNTSPLLNNFKLTRLRGSRRQRVKQRAGVTGVCRNLNNLVGGCELLCDDWCVFVFSRLFKLYIIECECLVSP